MPVSSKQVVAAVAGGALLFWAGRTLVRHMRAANFDGKTVLITGGSRGLGLILARQFGDEGANLILCARDRDELHRAADEIARRGVRVWPIVCDVTDEDSVATMVKQVETTCGAVDVLVNNAGVIQCGPMETMTEADYEEAMQTHFYGPLRLIEGLLPGMRRRQCGHIVNIASIGGMISVPHLLPYSASKFALVGYSQGLGHELAKDGIAVTTVCPGLMRTGSARNAWFKGQHRDEYALFKIMDSLPIASMSAERAAQAIVDACRQRLPFVVLGASAKIAAKLAALAPGLAATALGILNAALPGNGGIGSRRARGFDSESQLSESWLTTLTDRAARRNNEFAPSSNGH